MPKQSNGEGMGIPRSKRREMITSLLAWWDEEVGERPDNLESALGNFVKILPLASVQKALENAADCEHLEDAEDVLDNANSRVRRWALERASRHGGRSASA